MPSPVVAVPPLLRSLKNLRGIRPAIGRDGCRYERSQHDHQALIDPPSFPRPNARAKRLACPADTQRPSEAPHLQPAGTALTPQESHRTRNRRFLLSLYERRPFAAPCAAFVVGPVSSFQRSNVSKCSVPCCCPPCVRVQHGCPARCGTAVATMRFDTANAYYDIAFAVPGVKT